MNWKGFITTDSLLGLNSVMKKSNILVMTADLGGVKKKGPFQKGLPNFPSLYPPDI